MAVKSTGSEDGLRFQAKTGTALAGTTCGLLNSNLNVCFGIVVVGVVLVHFAVCFVDFDLVVMGCDSYDIGCDCGIQIDNFAFFAMVGRDFCASIYTYPV